MADQVREILEEMVPELEDLQNRNLFSKEEIKSIVKNRTDFEYALKRQQPEKADFLKYAEYEMNLEQLRKRRQQKIGDSKKSISNFAGVRRIHFIFDRTLSRFKGDIRVWLQYIDFCKKQGSEKVLSRVFVRALQLHPTNSGLWIMAASHEFQSNLNMTSARVLMQRAIRMNPTCQKVWLEYCRLELLYIAKIKERRRILLEEDQKKKANSVDGSGKKRKRNVKDQGDGQTGQEPDDSFKQNDDYISLPDVPDAEVSEQDRRQQAEVNQAEDESDAAYEAFCAGAVPKVIYKNAIAKIASDLDFRLEFAKLARQFDDSGASLLDDVQESIRRDFTSTPAGWNALALWRIDKSNPKWWRTQKHAIADAVDIFEQGVQAVDAPQMWLHYLQFLADRLISATAPDQPSPATPQQATALALEMDKVFKRARAGGQSNDALLSSYVAACLQSGRVEEARSCTRKVCASRPRSAVPWVLAAKAALAQTHTEEDSDGVPGTSSSAFSANLDALSLLKQGLSNVQPADSGPLWKLLLEQHFQLTDDVDKVHEAVSGAVRSRCPEVSSFKEMYVLWAIASAKPSLVRTVYKRLTSMPPIPLPVYESLLRFERSLPSSDAQSPQELRAMYEAAITEYGAQSHELWISYIQWERGQGRIAAANQLHWKAMRALTDTTTFTAVYDSIK